MSTKEVQDELEELWCSDDELCPIPSFLIDDADIEHSEDDEEKDEEFELNVPDMESLTELISDLKATEKRWRETGFKAGVRGYGTSNRTFYRNNAKVAQWVASGEGSTGLMSWLRSHASTDNWDLASSPSTFEAEANHDVDKENNIENDEIDYLKFNDTFEEILNYDTNKEGTRNNRCDRTSNNEIVKNKYIRTEAIALLLDTHAIVSRNVAVELKKM